MRKEVENSVVSIFVHKAKAYVPTMAKTTYGIYITVEPVFVVSLEFNPLFKVIERQLARGNPKILQPTKEEINNMPQPVLTAAGVGTWYKLSQGGTTYDITQLPKGFMLEFYKKDEKGRFVADASRRKHFLTETHLSVVVEELLKDILLRPELLN